jgi:hypothetical protein
MGVCRSFREVLGGGDEIFMVLPNYLPLPLHTLRSFVLLTPIFFRGRFLQPFVLHLQRDSLRRFRIFPFLGRKEQKNGGGTRSHNIATPCVRIVTARPSLSFFRGLLRYEEVPEEWWCSW